MKKLISVVLKKETISILSDRDKRYRVVLNGHDFLGAPTFMTYEAARAYFDDFVVELRKEAGL